MSITVLLAIFTTLLISIVVLNWRLQRTIKQRDEAVQKGSVANAVIQNVKEAQTIKKSNAQRTTHDRTQRMRSKGYLRD